MRLMMLSMMRVGGAHLSQLASGLHSQVEAQQQTSS